MSHGSYNLELGPYVGLNPNLLSAAPGGSSTSGQNSSL
jgi:hypothetical protein